MTTALELHRPGNWLKWNLVRNGAGWLMLICHDATCLRVLLVVHSSGGQTARNTLMPHTEITQQMDFGLLVPLSHYLFFF